MKLWMMLFFMALPLAQAQMSACDYTMTIANATIQIEDSARVVQQPINISRGQLSPTGRCSLYRIFFSKGVSNSYQRRAFTIFGQDIDYNLHRNINQSGVLKDFSDAVTASEYLEGMAPEKNTTYTNRFFLAAPGQDNNVLAAGTYFDIVQVSIYGYNENSGKYLFDETDSFTVLFYVPKKVQVSLLDEGGAFDASATSKTLDFGVIANGQEKGADLRILSNGSYKIRLSSTNNGYLKNTTGSDTISYTLRVNNSAINLAGSSSSAVQIGSGTITSEAGDLYNLKVRISDSTANKGAGIYQDVVTITAIAN